MAEEPVVIRVIRFVVELIWTLILVQTEVFKSIFNWCFPPEPKDVSEDIVLITGTGHGIGRQLALRFARLGAKVVCVDINVPNNDDTVQTIKKEKGLAFGYQCDVTNRAAVMDLAEKVTREVGEVTILINNAGIMPCKPILKHTEQEIRLMMDINVNGNLWTIQAFLPAMLENNNGHIVGLSSMAGLMGLRNLVPYCGSKYAVRGIMEALALELYEDPRNTNGIKFTTICPFMVNTGLCQKPRVKYPLLMNVVEVDEAADLIVDAIRREYIEITVPTEFYYTMKYIYRLIPISGTWIFNQFFDTGVDPHE